MSYTTIMDYLNNSEEDTNNKHNSHNSHNSHNCDIDDLFDAFRNQEEKPYNMFRNKFPTGIERMHQKIDECISENKSDLEIRSVNYEKIPEIVFGFEWITSLILYDIQLTDINSISYPPNLTSLTISKNEIDIIDCALLPDSLKILKLNHNNTVDIVNIKENIETLDLTNNQFTKLDCIIPKSVKILNLSDNKRLCSLPNMKNNTNLEQLILNNTSLEFIDSDKIPDTLIYLEISRCELDEINWLPPNLKHFEATRSKITKINYLPDSLENVDLYDNYLDNIPNFPIEIIKMDLSDNKLSHLPPFPKDISKIIMIDLTTNNRLIITDELKMLKEFNNIVRYTEFEENSSDSDIDFNLDDDYNDIFAQYRQFRNSNSSIPNIQKQEKEENVMLDICDPSNPHYIILKKGYSI